MVRDTHFDVLIVGSGAAGLSLALQLPETLSIGLLSKADLHSGSTSWALRRYGCSVT